MNITDFKPTQQSTNTPKDDLGNISNDDLNKVKDEYGDLVTFFLSKYGNMDEEELVGEMLKIVAKKKQEGTFDAGKIRQVANQIAPILNDEQRVKLQNLLNYLD